MMTNENVELLVLILIGIFAIIFGNYKRSEYNKLIATGIKTEGTIISLESSIDPESVSYFPKISYKTLGNQCVTKQYWIGRSQKKYKPGDSVTIIYDVNDHESFIIDDRLSKTAGPATLIAGCAVVIVAIMQYIFHPIPF